MKDDGSAVEVGGIAKLSSEKAERKSTNRLRCLIKDRQCILPVNYGQARILRRQAGQPAMQMLPLATFTVVQVYRKIIKRRVRQLLEDARQGQLPWSGGFEGRKGTFSRRKDHSQFNKPYKVLTCFQRTNFGGRRGRPSRVSKQATSHNLKT